MEKVCSVILHVAKIRLGQSIMEIGDMNVDWFANRIIKWLN